MDQESGRRDRCNCAGRRPSHFVGPFLPKREERKREWGEIPTFPRSADPFLPQREGKGVLPKYEKSALSLPFREGGEERAGGSLVNMSRSSGMTTRGFTLVEVLVATLLVAVAVTGVMSGISALTLAQSRARDADLLQRLAAQKINDLSILADPTTVGSSGDFSDRKLPGCDLWSADITRLPT